MGKNKIVKGADWAVRREEILVLAAALFAERGPDRVSMRDIATAADMHMSTIYHYFPNKQQLYGDVCDWAFEYSSALSISSLEGNEDSLGKLRRYVIANVQFLVEKGAAVRILEMELLFHTSNPTSKYPAIMVAPVARLASLLVMIDPPLLSHFSPEKLACVLWEVIYGISRYSAANARVTSHCGDDIDVPSVVEDVWEVIRKILSL